MLRVVSAICGHVENIAVLALPKLALLGLHHGNLQALASGGFRHGSLPSCSTVSDLVTCS
jgi:hypothetical protein